MGAPEPRPRDSRHAAYVARPHIRARQDGGEAAKVDALHMVSLPAWDPARHGTATVTCQNFSALLRMRTRARQRRPTPASIEIDLWSTKRMTRNSSHRCGRMGGGSRM
jgi:hypothetical protein